MAKQKRTNRQSLQSAQHQAVRSPLFRQRVVENKKGKGSYSRKQRNNRLPTQAA